MRPWSCAEVEEKGSAAHKATTAAAVGIVGEDGRKTWVVGTFALMDTKGRET